MTVFDLMTKKLILVQPDMALKEVADILRENRIHALPVVPADNMTLQGIITETDLVLKDECARYINKGALNYELSFLSQRGIDRNPTSEKVLDVRVSDVMSPKCITIHPEASIDELILTFRKTQFHSLPVIQSDDILMGIITLSDILKLY